VISSEHISDSIIPSCCHRLINFVSSILNIFSLYLFCKCIRPIIL
jgi:hypothetical protein